MTVNSTPLPDTAYIDLERHDLSNWEITITDGGILDGVYSGWCIDWGVAGVDGVVNVYSSYAPLPESITYRINEENLDLVDWILNQDWNSISSPEGDGFQWQEVQNAIWSLIDAGDVLFPSTSDIDTNHIIQRARQEGEGFVPDVDGNFLLILEPQDGGQIVPPPPLPIPNNPKLDVEKYVSVDGGKTWIDADDPAGPILVEDTFEPIFKFVVENTGNIDLRDITLSDSDFDLNGADPGESITIDFLAQGETYEYFFTAPWEVGQHTNTATVSTDYFDKIFNREIVVSDSDDANYLGKGVPKVTDEALCAVHVTKNSPDTEIDLFKTFDDLDNADSELTFTIEGNDNPELFDGVTIDSETGTLILDYNKQGSNVPGDAEITIKATDPDGYSGEYKLDVFVYKNNDPMRDGTDCNEYFHGGTGKDILAGNGGDDIIFGGNGNDELLGGDGDDILAGDFGKDELFGGDGDDLLNGGRGDDILTGGDGKDIFTLASGEGIDTINDFEDGIDLISLEGGLTFGQLEWEQNGDDVLVFVPGNGNSREKLATLIDFDASQLTQDDFVVA